MKNTTPLFFCLVIADLIFSFSCLAQSQYTPYDEISGINKTYKPSYRDDYPEWGKMLYQYPVNFNVINEAFERTETLAESKGSESPIKRYFLLWRKVIINHLDANGNIIIPNHKESQQRRTKSQLNSQKKRSSARVQGEGSWSFLGPKITLSTHGSPTGVFEKKAIWQTNIYCFDIASKNHKTLYAGSETGFISKSIDGGETWTLLGDYNFFHPIEALAVHPTQNNIVYAASAGQLHKSTDSGSTWTPLLSSGDPKINANRIRINTNPANQLIVGAAQGLFVKNENEEWKNKWNGVIFDAIIHPATPSKIFAVGKNEKSKKFFVISSVNSGQSFALMEGFPTDIESNEGAVMSMSAENTNFLYVLLLTPNNTPRLYTATFKDDKWTWALTNTGGESNAAFKMDNGQGYFDLVLESHVANHNIIYAGTTTLYVSRDGGKNFSALGGFVGNFPVHPDIQWIKTVASDSVWLATDGGMSLSTDNFTTVEKFQPKIQGLMGSDLWGFDQGWNEDLVVGGRYHNGNMALADYYDNKSIYVGGGEAATGWVLHGRERCVAFADIGTGILPKSLTSQLSGARFKFAKYPNMDDYGGRPSNVVSHPNYYNTIYVGEGSSLWLSTSYGAEFSMLYTFPKRVRYFQVSLTQPNILYLDVFETGLYKSEDGGVTWVQKPALTSSAYGGEGWKGNLFFCISPSDANTLYAVCNYGYPAKVFKSTDGGDTWSDWTADLPAGKSKHVLIQPDENGHDLVYVTMTSNSLNATNAGVYYRKANTNEWVNFSNNMPLGLATGFAKPFYRDSKIRLGTNCGVWESPMAVESFKPVIIPWVEASEGGCRDDTLRFEDHSILNHKDASWNWSITPAPAYIENANKRNPKVVLGAAGSYSVTLTVRVNGLSHSKTMERFVTAKACPSYKDCNNPGPIPRTAWKATADSEELEGEGAVNGRASAAIDGNEDTYWHTQWHSQEPPYPHHLKIDLGEKYQLSNAYFYPRAASDNGRIKDYELYLSENSSEDGSLVAKGSFDQSNSKKSVAIDKASGRYLTFKALSSHKEESLAALAEIEIVGCITSKKEPEAPKSDDPTGLDLKLPEKLSAYPIPVQSVLTLEIPFSNPNEVVHYRIISMDGKTIQNGETVMDQARCKFDLRNLLPGIYVMKVTNEQGQQATVKIIKK